ncbi:MAG: hypothetical protein Q7U47_01425 [Paludibacter sp.]|nr:hypothetical protein [Paludibacter sp.]
MSNIEETNQTPTEINHFGEWINNLPVGAYPEVRKNLLRECKITEQVFRHWKCGNSKVPVLAHGIINQIAGKEIFKHEV